MTIALLCLAEPTSIEVGPPNSIARYAEFRIGDAAVSVQISSDHFAEWLPDGASLACEGEACLSYRKLCGRREAEWFCRYHTANMIYAGGWLTIRAPDEAAVRAAEAGLGVRVRLDADGRETAIPLSKFDVASPLPPWLAQ